MAMAAAKDGNDEEGQAFLDSPYGRHCHKQSAAEDSLPGSSRRSWICYLRLLLELAMAAAIVALLVRLSSGSVKPSPVPQCMFAISWTSRWRYILTWLENRAVPRKSYIFVENRTYLNEEMFASREATIRTLHNWLGLSAGGNIFVCKDR